MFLLIVATLNSPANYFLALYAQSLNRTRNLNLTIILEYYESAPLPARP